MLLLNVQDMLHTWMMDFFSHSVVSATTPLLLA
jgi:hypothetical protein